MPDRRPTVVHQNPWTELRRFTQARIALGRVGSSLPTDEVLRFGLAHAAARDAVHQPLDFPQLESDLAAGGYTCRRLRSRAPDRHTYLLRPDLGRRLAEGSRAALAGAASDACDLAFVIADGLSAFAVQRHAVPLLAAVGPGLAPAWRIAPIVLVEQGRVAVADEIGELLAARLVVLLIGERPGLSSPDSLGCYLTYAPRVGRTDADRNCISNIRPEGLAYPDAAPRLVWLLGEALRLQLTGVALIEPSPFRPSRAWRLS